MVVWGYLAVLALLGLATDLGLLDLLTVLGLLGFPPPLDKPNTSYLISFLSRNSK